MYIFEKLILFWCKFRKHLQIFPQNSIRSIPWQGGSKGLALSRSKKVFCNANQKSLNSLNCPTLSLCQGVPHGHTESGGIVLAVMCWSPAPRGSVTRQGVVLTDLLRLKSLLDFNKTSLSLSCLPTFSHFLIVNKISLSLSLSLSLSRSRRIVTLQIVLLQSRAHSRGKWRRRRMLL